MFEAKPVQAFSRFITSTSTGGGELFVNRRSRFPFRVRLQQLARIEARLVKPEKFMWPVWAHSLIDNGVKTGECGSAISFFFQAKPLLEERLVAPMRRCIFIRCQLIVSFNRALVVLRVGRGHFEKNVALAANCFAFFPRASRAV